MCNTRKRSALQASHTRLGLCAACVCACVRVRARCVRNSRVPGNYTSSPCVIHGRKASHTRLCLRARRACVRACVCVCAACVCVRARAHTRVRACVRCARVRVCARACVCLCVCWCVHKRTYTNVGPAASRLVAATLASWRGCAACGSLARVRPP